MIRFNFITVLFLLGLSAYSQPLFEKEKTIPGTFTSIAVDNLENIYLLTASNQLKKLNENGDSIAVFNNIKKFGEASLLDISNPLKVLLYYKNFATVVMLDRLLNPVNTIDLRQQNIFNADAIGLSYDGKVWVYDNAENVLKKISEDGKVLLKTPDFRQLFNDALAPRQIIDRNSLVYVYDTAHGIFTFDYYGSFKKKIPITGWKLIQVTDKYIYGYDAHHFYRYSLLGITGDEWPIPDELKGKRQYLFTNRTLFVLNETDLTIYRVNE